MLALADMNNEALERELRLAYNAGNRIRVGLIKRHLAKRARVAMPYNTYGNIRALPADKRWWDD
jgi:hypothetical protein